MSLLRASKTATSLSKEAFIGKALGALGKGLWNIAKRGGGALKAAPMKTMSAAAGIGGGAYVAGQDIAKGTKINNRV